jgi:hypothetical protein
LTNYYERRGNIPGFSSLSIFRYGTEVVGDTGSTQQEKVMRISPDFFTTLGTGPVMGRSFEEAETITPVENHGAVILTDGYWHDGVIRANPIRAIAATNGRAFTTRATGMDTILVTA